MQLVPRWVAPNVLTFSGFLLTVLDFILLSYYDYDYTAASAVAKNETLVEPLNGRTEVIPQTLWYFLAVFLFLAYTLGMFFIYFRPAINYEQNVPEIHVFNFIMTVFQTFL